MKHLLSAQNVALLMLAGLFCYFATGATGRMTERIVTTVGSTVVFYIAALCIAAFAHTAISWTLRRKPWSLLHILNITVAVLIALLAGISGYHTLIPG
ncbi:MAG: hypothetical protein ACI33N_02345 [Desulfovibrionaceae bacterium]|nr:hypothetical protein [Desulfovibrionaceae bacterium]